MNGCKRSDEAVFTTEKLGAVKAETQYVPGIERSCRSSILPDSITQKQLT